MRYFLDFKYNGEQGALLTMCLLREDNLVMLVGFHENIHIQLEPWVAENIVPAMNSSPIPIRWMNSAMVRKVLPTFFHDDTDIKIITNRPDDVIRFNKLSMLDWKTSILDAAEMPRVTFQIERVEAYPTEVTPAVQHSSYWDAMALRHKIDYPNGQPKNKKE